MNKKTFTVELSTDNHNNIDAKEVHLALMKYFVAFVGIDVKEVGEDDGELPCRICGGEVGHRANCPHGIYFVPL